MPVEWIHEKPRTPRWFDLRKNVLTMSELPAVAGVGLYGTAYSVWAVKAGLAAPPEENDAMQRGDWLECAVPPAFLKQHPGFEITYPLDTILIDTERGIGGTPDAAGVDPDLAPVAFEFKVISRQSYERYWADGPPIAYQLQTLGNTMLMGAHYGLLCALVLGWQDVELVVHRVDRHAAAEASMIDIARRFWEAFDEGHALAAPDYSRDAEILAQVFAPDKNRPAPVDLSADNLLAEVLIEREDLSKLVSRGKKRLDELKAEIIHKLGGAESATYNDWKISNTTVHKAAHWQAESNYARLTVTPPKETAA